MRVVIIGTGNVAHVLGSLLYQAGHDIVQVCGRNPAAATELAGILKSRPVFSWKELSREADVYLLAISDTALWQLTDMPAFRKGLLVHTAGSVPSDVLSGLSETYGVLYPLQTLKKNHTPAANIPFLIHGNSALAIGTIMTLASSLSSSVTLVSDSDRAKLHLAATMVNNFTNHLFALTYVFCTEENLPFGLLAPLIRETAARIGDENPAAWQTGPAVRKDFVTIERHKAILEDQPLLHEMYRLFSESIMQLSDASGGTK